MGIFSPLKFTADIQPMDTQVIELTLQRNARQLVFHCHILYHMMSGNGPEMVPEREQ